MNNDERALLLEIAKLAGWRLEKLATGYRLIGPHDETYGIPEKYATNDDEAWHIASLNVPDYVTDANAALTLVDTVPGTFHLQSSARGMWQAWFDTPSVPQANEDTPALAICKAWLSWKRCVT